MYVSDRLVILFTERTIIRAIFNVINKDLAIQPNLSNRIS
jgi:hypothetical protein